MTETKTSEKHSKTATLHVHITHFVHFLPITARLQCEIPSSNILSWWRTYTQHDEFFFHLLHLDSVSKNSVPGKFTDIWHFSELELGLLTKFEKKQHLFNNVMFLLLLPSSLPKLFLYFDKSLIYRIFFKRYFYLPWFSKLSWIHLLNGIILKVLQADLVPVPRTCCWRNRWIWLLMSQTAQ